MKLQFKLKYKLKTKQMKKLDFGSFYYLFNKIKTDQQS
jgi:hypothetical protein